MNAQKMTDVARTVWRRNLPEGVRDIAIFGGGTPFAVAYPVNVARGRYGYCAVEGKLNMATLDRAIERAVCACWFDSPYLA